jgi:predicted Holliday junction resolvase-like endonuclease
MQKRADQLESLQRKVEQDQARIEDVRLLHRQDVEQQKKRTHDIESKFFMWKAEEENKLAQFRTEMLSKSQALTQAQVEIEKDSQLLEEQKSSRKAKGPNNNPCLI